MTFRTKDGFSTVGIVTKGGEADFTPVLGNTTLQPIFVESRPPGADIFIDGFPTDQKTPCLAGKLSPGWHRIFVSKPGYYPEEEILELAETSEPGRQQNLSFILDQYPHGSISIASDPLGAKVYLDGILTGEQTPCTLSDLPIGEHEVRLDKKPLSKELSVLVEPEKDLKMTVVLQP